MTTLPVNVADVASRFFDKYLICLAKAGVPEKRRRWYVKHIEAFIKAQNGRKIKTLSAEDVNQYFDMLGRQNRLPGRTDLYKGTKGRRSSSASSCRSS